MNQIQRQQARTESHLELKGQIPLGADSVVAVIGGGPAGAFFAIQLLRKASELGRRMRVLVFERRHQPAAGSIGGEGDCWRGCNHCAGGISPKLVEVLRRLNLDLPEAVIQSRIRNLTIQGYWKNIHIEVPEGREMLSVFRGSRPSRRGDPQQNLDGFLLQAAQGAGAELIGGDVIKTGRSANGKPVITYRRSGFEASLEADLLVFAAGVNAKPGLRAEDNPMFRAVQQMLPDFRPPRLRRALIFEMELEPGKPPWLEEELYYVEYGSKSLPLEMSSLVPKRGFITAVLVGKSVDLAVEPAASRAIMNQFLELPQIRKLVPPRTQLRLACACSPSMVVGSARNPFGHRVAVIGDMVTARLYKDGLLSAQQTAQALAEAVLEGGVDEGSLRRHYGPVVRQFCRDNRYAAMVFLLHRVVFSSSVLSRLLYQAVLTERKNTPAPQRNLEKILWRIASGDDRYEQVFRSMMRPMAWRSILIGGVAVTFRNYLAELFFGLRWAGFGRHTTGVARERLEAKRATFARWLDQFGPPVPSGREFEFERMYTIKIRAPAARVLSELGRFGEPERGYLHPRWVRIQRVAGLPNTLGCTIEYQVLLPRCSFRLVLEHRVSDHLLFYRVQNGFARGGVLIFELESRGPECCNLSIYVAFNFQRGCGWLTRPLFWLFRRTFPAFVHDVIWNHSLCQLKDLIEEHHQSGHVLLRERERLADHPL
jgi:flavin-dependent dehydrogenase